MGRQTEFDGIIYCDWRINVRNCVDEEIFFGFQAFGTVTYFLSAIILAFVIFFRAVILKETFHRGANLGLIGTFLLSVCYTIHGILLFFGNSPVATGVFWGLHFSIGFVPHINNSYSLTMALPGYLSSRDRVYIRYIPSPKIFSKITIFFIVQLNVIFMVLLGLSEHWNSTGVNFELSNILFICALSYFSFNLIIFLPYALFGSFLFLKIGNEKLKMIGKNFEEGEPVRIALFKAKQNIRGILTIEILVLVPFLSLAIDNNVFRDLPLSKTCCFFTTIPSLFLLLLSFVSLATDIKKKLFNNKKKRSSEGHHGSSPKARSHSKPQLQIESLETKDSPDI